MGHNRGLLATPAQHSITVLQPGPPDRHGIPVPQLSGICMQEEVVAFFSDCEIVENGVTLCLASTGRATGEVHCFSLKDRYKFMEKILSGWQHANYSPLLPPIRCSAKRVTQSVERILVVRQGLHSSESAFEVSTSTTHV